ncbi:MAG: hypothetical protein Fur007_00830 [Rhodoferax sp.]
MSRNYAAPSLVWRLRPSAQPRQIALSLSVMTGATLLGWRMQAQVQPEVWLGILLAWLAVSAWAVWALAKPANGDLLWRDGAWHWLAAAGRHPSVALRLRVIWPGQRHLWLAVDTEPGAPRAAAHAAPPRWLWLSQAHDPAQWLALRRAVFNPGVAGELS